MKYYFIEHETSRNNYCITDESDELITISKQEKSLLMKNDEKKQISFYECYDYDNENGILETLKLFKKDFNDFSTEISNVYDIKDYNYFNPKNYISNGVMVMCLFKKYASKLLKSYNIPDIGKIESSYQENTNNGALTFLKEKGFYENCFGYDLSGCYPNFLGNKDLKFKFPINKGEQSNYKSIDNLKLLHKTNKLQYGYYDIKITSEHPDVTKIFKFSQDDVYDHTSINFAFRHKQLYKFKFEIIEKEYNCYLYNEKDLVESHKIFGKWFEVIKNLKSKLPKNKIVKHVSSSLWGSIIKFERSYITEDEYLNRDDIDKSLNGDKPFYTIKYHNERSIEILNKSKIYTNNLARIKAFLTSYIRDFMAELIIKNKLHNNIIRVHTDGIVLDKEFKFEGAYIPLPEDKSTGDLFFVNLNKCYHKCQKCNNFFKFEKTGCPDCLLSTS